MHIFMLSESNLALNATYILVFVCTGVCVLFSVSVSGSYHVFVSLSVCVCLSKRVCLPVNVCVSLLCVTLSVVLSHSQCV